METERAILSEKLEDRRKAVEWAKIEQLSPLEQKDVRLAKELMNRPRPSKIQNKKEIIIILFFQKSFPPFKMRNIFFI